MKFSKVEIRVKDCGEERMMTFLVKGSPEKAMKRMLKDITRGERFGHKEVFGLTKGISIEPRPCNVCKGTGTDVSKYPLEGCWSCNGSGQVP